MPLLTARGDVLAGGGGSQGSRNGIPYPFASSGRGCAIDEGSQLLVQVKPQEVLATWRPDTGALDLLGPLRGANALAGGGGRWLADGAGLVYGTLGDIPGAALIGAAPDGTLAYYPSAASGIGLVIVDPDGTPHDYPNVIAKPAPRVIQAGQVIWQGGAVGRAPLKPALANAAGPQLVPVAGEDWIVYWAEGVGLIAQVDGEASGWILDTRAIEYNASAANVGGALRIAWSITAGEGPRDIVVCQVSRAGVTYLTAADNWTAQVARWGVLVPPAPPLVQPAFRLTHSVILAPFKAAGSGLPDLFDLGDYTEAVDPRPITFPPNRRVLLAHDGRSDWVPPPGLRPFDLPLLEGYLDPLETLAQSVARWTAQMGQVLAVWPGDVGWIPMWYDQFRWTLAQILDGLRALDTIVNLSPRIKVIAPFAYNRANGIVKYPELQAALGNLNTEAVRVGKAVLTPIDPPPPPPPPPEKPMTIPPIGDDQIIELAAIYDAQPMNRAKSDEAYLRDAAYYGCGYMRLRAAGLSPDAARDRYQDAASRDDYYRPNPPGMFVDDDVIELRQRWVARYQSLGRYQHQSRQENARDLTYWLIVYARAREAGKDHEHALQAMENGMAQEAGQDLPFPEPAAPPVQALTEDRQIFRLVDGTPWRWRGVSAFQLLDRFARGEDLDPFLQAYGGFNLLRVWPYVPAADWGAAAWNPPPVEVIRDFVAHVNILGWWVELTLLTDDSPARLAWAEALVPQLGTPAGLLLEGGNEPLTHKQINTPRLKSVLAASGLPYASGDYEESPRAYGTYLVAHTARDADWPRRAHDALEYYSGGGPNFPSDPAHRCPIVLDEPAKLEDVSGDRAVDWLAYFAAASLLGAGATFHSQTGKFAQPPTDAEAALAAQALAGLTAFPADAPLGGYQHGKPEQDDEQATGSLRTYRVGPYGVRIRPRGGAPILLGV